MKNRIKTLGTEYERIESKFNFFMDFISIVIGVAAFLSVILEKSQIVIIISITLYSFIVCSFIGMRGGSICHKYYLIKSAKAYISRFRQKTFQDNCLILIILFVTQLISLTFFLLTILNSSSLFLMSLYVSVILLLNIAIAYLLYYLFSYKVLRNQSKKKHFKNYKIYQKRLQINYTVGAESILFLVDRPFIEKEKIYKIFQNVCIGDNKGICDIQVYIEENKRTSIKDYFKNQSDFDKIIIIPDIARLFHEDGSMRANTSKNETSRFLHFLNKKGYFNEIYLTTKLCEIALSIYNISNSTVEKGTDFSDMEKKILG